MSKINQPSNQIKLTNVSIVRLKKGGKRFEIACYKNKVQEWRNGVETNLDDVLQIANVFINVSKGEVAKHQDLKKAFNTTDSDVIVAEILKKGEVQVGEKEREHDLSATRKEIATLIAEKCVDPETQRPHPVGMIDKAMTEAGFSVKVGKTAKSQVSECIRLLQTSSTLPIQRARMRIRVSITNPSEEIKKKVLESAELVEKEAAQDGKDAWEATLLIDPAQFRMLNDLLQKVAKGNGRIETLAFNTASTTSM